MRLTCPNCGAQYEVPDEVMPKEGRDVQCSNCGNTWFQVHPESSGIASEPESPPQETEPAEAGQPHTEGSEDSRPDPDPEHSEPDAEPQGHEIDSEVSEILREEAEREANLRAAETAEALESQPDLGLENVPGDETSQRAREASDRMARMRGEPTQEPEAADPEPIRETLPDIEEISSTLRNTDDGASPHTAVGPARVEPPQQKRGGFARGFALIVILGLILALIYINAPRISNAVPQAEPVLNSYVTLVDQARNWLDARLGEFTPSPEQQD